MTRGILFGAGVSLAALTSGHAEARQSDLREACAQEARLPTPDDETGKRYDDIVVERAIQLCRRALAAEPGNADVLANLGRALTKGGEGKEAFPLIERAAAAGSMQAANTLASMYEAGDGVAKDPARALSYARAGEKSRYVWIVGRLAEYYLKGVGTAPDRQAGLALYARAADLGNPGAAKALGDIYRFAQHGVARDYALARKWYARAMAMGDDDSVTALGYMAERGQGGAVDLVEARRLYGVGAERGSGWGAENLAGMLQTGRGGPKDEAEAARYVRLAVDRGQTSAMRRLGTYYRDGIGVEQDVQMAIAWFRKAF